MDNNNQVSLLTKVRELLAKREEEILELKEVKEELENKIRDRTKKLEQKIEEIGRVNRFMVDRELKMSELKKEIVSLKQRLGEV